MADKKFKSLVQYICSRRMSAPDTLGAVKLNKILWLADLSAFHETGKAITSARYIKREFGPVPSPIMPALRELEADGILSVTNSTIYGKTKKKYVVHIPINGDFLEPQELAIVDEVIDHVCDTHTAASVSLASHNHIWMAADDGEEIPHFTVFARPGKLTAVEREWAQLQLQSEAA